ncbi:MAG: hypothetical protein ABIE03_06725 [Patescibacteria group bacterium]|nr:hypothetical protein [Patescibacteria group bacterium]
MTEELWEVLARKGRVVDREKRASNRLNPENLSPQERALMSCLARLEDGVNTISVGMLAPVFSADALSTEVIRAAIKVLQDESAYTAAAHMILKLVARPDQLQDGNPYYRSIGSTSKIVEITKNLPLLNLLISSENPNVTGSITQAILHRHSTIYQFLSAVDQVRQQLPGLNQRRISTIAANLYGREQDTVWRTLEGLRHIAERV